MSAMLMPSMAWCDTVPAKMGRFPQEIATKYTTEQGLPSNNVLKIQVADDGTVYAVTDQGLSVFREGAWVLEELAMPGSMLMQCAYVQQLGRMTAGDPGSGHAAVLLPSPMIDDAIFQDLLSGERAYWIATATGLQYEIPGERQETVISDGPVHQLAMGPDGRAIAAAENGLYIEVMPGQMERLVVSDGMGREWATAAVRGVVFDTQGRLWFATPAGLGCRTAESWSFFTGAEGLPYNDFTCAAAEPAGAVWFGTRMGAIRFDGRDWFYRQGQAWLPDDDVRHIAVDKAGNVWFATAGGVARIEYRMMTLAEKAAFYEKEIEIIKRTPFGYTSEVRLGSPGDKSDVIHTDSDNDGLWTSMYGAGEAFGYAATGDPERKERAKQAFEALRFLQVVTQGGEHSPPKGYVARTILPADGPDPNIGRLESDIKHRETRDSLWKVYEPRWPKSEDGQWYWKSDTSSDELDGHYFFYPAYYDYAADTPEEKERVREVVRDLTDHLIDHGYYLVDIDGSPTRWSIYGPNSLNDDPNWWPERGLKSLSMLSYLAVAEHVTGQTKYGRHALELVRKHAYRANAMFPKVQFGIGSGNQSDDEMAIMCFYNLMKYCKHEEIKSEILYSFYAYWTLMQPEMNPFFNFAYAAFGLDATYTNPWGTHTVAPWRGWLDDSVETLKRFPLDRVGWGRKNSHRLDIVRLPRQQAAEPYELPGRNRGHRVNGKVLPVEERFFHHWNTDPWSLDYGGNGTSLGSGTVFLLPYYMGLYHGFIEETE
jgi:hypothetical protein